MAPWATIKEKFDRNIWYLDEEMMEECGVGGNMVTKIKGRTRFLREWEAGQTSRVEVTCESHSLNTYFTQYHDLTFILFSLITI